MANGAGAGGGAGMGVGGSLGKGSLGRASAGKGKGKSSTGRTSTGKGFTGQAVGGGGRQAPVRSTGPGGGQKPLVNMSQLLGGQGGGAGVPAGMPGAGAPTGVPGMFGAGIPSGGVPASIGGLPTVPGDPSQYDFGMQNMGDLASLDFGPEARTPESYISGRGGAQIGSVSRQDVGDFLSNLTTSKLENLSPEERTAFDERMGEATKRKESLRWPTGADPELMERRITAAESEKWPNSADFFKELRSWQTEPTTLQNVGSMLKTGAKEAIDFGRNIFPFSHMFPRPLWPATAAKQVKSRRMSDIISGEGTSVDQNKLSEFIKNRRAENYAAGTTVPPGKEYLASYMRGNEDRVQEAPYNVHLRNAPDLYFPFPQPEPSKAVKSYRKHGTVLPVGAATAQRQAMTGRILPGERNYGGGGRDGTKEKEEKKTFNLLEMLMNLLGLGGGKSTGKSPQKNLNREPGPGERDTRPAQFGVEPTIG